MAATLTPTGTEPELRADDLDPQVVEVDQSDDGTPEEPASEPRNDIRPLVRPALAAGLATVAAALVSGGIFGSWSARLLGVVATAVGVAWALAAQRTPERTTAYQLTVLPVSLAASTVFVVLAGGNPGSLPELIADAVESGRVLRPPVPFDPGWIPILFVVFGLLGFGATWIATALGRDRLAIALPLPLLALTAMTQPDDGQFVAGLVAFVPLIGSLAVLFGGDGASAAQLTREFELKRAARGLGATALAVLALFVLSRADILFPEPVFDPDDRAQKPKPIPLSEIDDVVLFEVQTESGVTGPWRTGVLDVYDGEAWRLPPFSEDRLVEIPADGVIDPVLAEDASIAITFTTRGLDNATSLPGPTGAAIIQREPALDDVRYDPRTGTFRISEGRLPPDAGYTVQMPPYPRADVLAEAPAPTIDVSVTTEIPSPPGVVRDLLDAAPAEPAWARMDFLRTRLREIVVASGGGVPADVPPDRVAAILEGPDHEATPFEIVAAEAMLARWAGVPSRIGFGFDGLNDEDGVLTVRPRNAAQWLEVYFEGHGWVPLIEPPQQAKNQLDDEDQLFDPDTLATDEIAVDVYVPVELENLQELYQRIRAQLFALAPWFALLLAAYLASPEAMRQWRRYKRRAWARARGPRAQVVVEYAEFRDHAHDLNLGDPLDTPLEYRKRVVADDEHDEMAWLVARVLYGDLRDIGDEQVKDAEDLSASLRRRMFRAQPMQVRLLAVLSRASLRAPYTDEVPGVALLDPLGRLSRWRRARRAARRGSPRLVRRTTARLRRRFT